MCDTVVATGDVTADHALWGMTAQTRPAHARIRCALICLCCFSVLIPLARSEPRPAVSPDPLARSEPRPAVSPDPLAIQEVLAGQRTEANAAWWGFDPDDATESIQSAIQSKVPTVIIPYMGRPWIVRPMTLVSHQEIVFEPGVILLAKKGEFLGGGDAMFTAQGVEEITLRGYGACLRMRKEDYQKRPYEKAEWRTVLDFGSSSHVRILGLRLERSGGDGIYLGVGDPNRPFCEDIVIRDVACVANHRQGISVISAKNLLIENCQLTGTQGTAPQAGIDFEPNSPNERIENCVVRNCIMDSNQGAGILVYLKPLSAQSTPVSLSVEGCHIKGNRDVGIGIGAVKEDGPDGAISFKDCTVEGNSKGGLYLFDKAATRAKVRFIHCAWDVRGAKSPALRLHARRAELARSIGGVEFIGCNIFQNSNKPVLIGESGFDEGGMRDITGQLFVHRAAHPRMDFQCPTSGVDLRVESTHP